jgi:predicted RNA-binding Zn-ribbon protein involved in translation (DUF1610 family)
MLCTNCGFRGLPRSVTPGSIIIELGLYIFCLIIGGLIYSIWRISARHKACPSCGNRNMIPENSVMAQQFAHREHAARSPPPVPAAAKTQD